MSEQEHNRTEIIGKIQYRAVTERAETIDAEKRTIKLSFSSDKPIEHWFGTVVLSHTDGCANLERLNTAAGFLRNHDRNQRIGKVVRAWIENGKGYAEIRISRNQLGNDFWQDYEDDCLIGTSFGFFINSFDDGLSDYKNNKYVSTDWTPYEISDESIPADISVGVGRSAEVNSQNLNNQPALDVRENSTTEKIMENENPNGEGTEQRQQSATVVAQSQEVTRIAEFTAIGEQFGEIDLARDLALTDGKTIADLKRAIAEKRQASQVNVPTKPVVDLTEKERKQYSISRAILADANIRDGKADNCFELEVSETARKNAVRNIPNYENKGGVIIPTNVALRGAREAMIAQMRGFDRQFARGMSQLGLLTQLTRAGLDTLTDTAGQELVFTEEGAFIELLRNRAMIMQLGATVLPGLVGNVAFPKQIGAGTFSWVGENPGSDVADSNLTLDQVTLSPKTGQSTTSYSRQLLAQSNVNVDGLVQSDLVQITSLAIDRAAIHGSGTSNQPTGLYAASGVNSVAFGGSITLDKVVDMETEISTDNADIGTMAYLTTMGARGKAKKTQEFSSTNGMALWRDGEMNGYRAEATNQVSSVMNASAATGGTSHGILFGVWSQLLFGEWGAMEIITDPYRLKKQGMIEVTNFIMIDIKPRYAESFCKGTGQSLS